MWDNVSQHTDDDDNDPMYNGDQVDHRHQCLCVGNMSQHRDVDDDNPMYNEDQVDTSRNGLKFDCGFGSVLLTPFA